MCHPRSGCSELRRIRALRSQRIGTPIRRSRDPSPAISGAPAPVAGTRANASEIVRHLPDTGTTPEPLARRVAPAGFRRLAIRQTGPIHALRLIPEWPHALSRRECRIPSLHSPTRRYRHTTGISNISKCQLCLVYGSHCVYCIPIEVHSPVPSGRRLQEQKVQRRMRAPSTALDRCAVTGMDASRDIISGRFSGSEEPATGDRFTTGRCRERVETEAGERNPQAHLLCNEAGLPPNEPTSRGHAAACHPRGLTEGRSSPQMGRSGWRRSAVGHRPVRGRVSEPGRDERGVRRAQELADVGRSLPRQMVDRGGVRVSRPLPAQRWPAWRSPLLVAGRPGPGVSAMPSGGSRGREEVASLPGPSARQGDRSTRSIARSEHRTGHRKRTVNSSGTLCETCRYFDLPDVGEADDDGTCRLNPPSPISGHEALWPRVQGHDRFGRHPYAGALETLTRSGGNADRHP